MIPCYDNKNFFVYHNKKEMIEGVYIAHHSEEVKEVKWLTGTGKQMLSVSDKLCYARTTNSGSWSFSMIDIQSDLLPLNFYSSKHFNDKALMKEYEHAQRTSHHEKIALTCACPNPLW